MMKPSKTLRTDRYEIRIYNVERKVCWHRLRIVGGRIEASTRPTFTLKMSHYSPLHLDAFRAIASTLNLWKDDPL